MVFFFVDDMNRCGCCNQHTEKEKVRRQLCQIDEKEDDDSNLDRDKQQNNSTIQQQNNSTNKQINK